MALIQWQCMIVVGLLFILTGALSQIPGGLGGQKPADESVREALSDHQVKTHLSALRELQGVNDKLEPVAYKSQVVAGTNYFVKVHAGGDRYFHVRIFRSLKGEYSVAGTQFGKTATDPIEYFSQNSEA